MPRKYRCCDPYASGRLYNTDTKVFQSRTYAIDVR